MVPRWPNSELTFYHVSWKRCKTFIITYHPHAPDIRKWVREAHPILLSDSKLKEIYPRPPSVVFRQAPNLKQILVKSVLRELPFADGSDREQERPGCFKHNHPARGRRCETCPRLNESQRFTSTFTSRTYKIWSKFTCKSKFVVYLVICARCRAQYVGKTVNTMMDRHNGHRREVEEKSTPPWETFRPKWIKHLFTADHSLGQGRGRGGPPNSRGGLDSATSHHAGAGGIKCKG